jgi:hypothetical protein
MEKRVYRLKDQHCNPLLLRKDPAFVASQHASAEKYPYNYMGRRNWLEYFQRSARWVTRGSIRKVDGVEVVVNQEPYVVGNNAIKRTRRKNKLEARRAARPDKRRKSREKKQRLDRARCYLRLIDDIARRERKGATE